MPPERFKEMLGLAVQALAEGDSHYAQTVLMLILHLVDAPPPVSKRPNLRVL